MDERYINFNDLTPEINDLYENGKPTGYNIGFECTKDKITIMAGFYSLWYGAPQSGKTRLILCICCHLAKRYKLNFALYSKEEGLPKDLLRLLASIWVGKPFFEAGYSTPRMTESELSRAVVEISEHFFAVGGRISGFEEVPKAVKEIENTSGKTIFGIVVDPLNTLVTANNNIAGMYEEGFDSILDWLQETGKHCFMGTHPTNPKDFVKQVHGVDVIKPIQPWQLAGGQTLWRKGYLMVSLYRHRADELMPDHLAKQGGQTYKGNEISMFVQKAKPEGSAQLGQYSVAYDVERHNYYEWKPDGTRKFNVDIEHIEQKEFRKLQPKITFDEDGTEPTTNPSDEAPF